METLYRWRFLPLGHEKRGPSTSKQISVNGKFTAEISYTEIAFLDKVVYKGARFEIESILDIKTHYKPTETFQYTHYTSCHLPGVKRGFIKGEAIRLLRTTQSNDAFYILAGVLNDQIFKKALFRFETNN